jgi:hypothetical protein
MSSPDDPRDLEETVDRLEERVLGHRVDQTRHDEDGASPPADDAHDDEPTD